MKDLKQGKNEVMHFIFIIAGLIAVVGIVIGIAEQDKCKQEYCYEKRTEGSEFCEKHKKEREETYSYNSNAYDDYDDDYDTYDDYDDDYSSSYSNSSSSSIDHYCDASGCTKEGIKVVTGLNGTPEYYCQEHYDEMQSIIGDMEQDVGNGSYSMHTCEECSREGTHKITGLNGTPEYYCTQHYNEIIDILNEIYDN